MKENKEVKISYWAAHMTTIVSVTLVLLIIGIIALLSAAASKETNRLKEKIELSVVMADTVSNKQAMPLFDSIKAAPYAASVKFISKEQALEAWKKDTGEDLEALFGVNPLSPEISFTVKASHASEAQIARISRSLAAKPGVEAVSSPDATMIDSMNSNIHKLTWILGAVALALLAISIVLINNTVHLTIYSRRFTIHTMQLVGATNGFIRRPFILNNMLSGFIAALVASLVLACVVFWAVNSGWPELSSTISWGAFFIICGGLVVVGVTLCALSASIATSRYLHKNYDQLFK